MDSTIEAGSKSVDLAEAARQLQQATHDARVAFDCIGLDEIQHKFKLAMLTHPAKR